MVVGVVVVAVDDAVVPLAVAEVDVELDRLDEAVVVEAVVAVTVVAVTEVAVVVDEPLAEVMVDVDVAVCDVDVAVVVTYKVTVVLAG